MPVSGALRRLLRLRELEEEQQRLALESALADLHALEQALKLARARQRKGRERIVRSAASGPADRIAACVESESAARHAAALAPRIAAAERETVRLRQLYLDKRVERRQAETIVRETEAGDALQSSRRAQQSLDDWYGARLQRNESVPERTTRHRASRPSDEKL
jgi:flagellar biosynthesis chaperone FliJ